MAELLRMDKKGVSKAEWEIRDVWESSQDAEGNPEEKKIGFTVRGECLKCWWSAELPEALRMKSLLCKSGPCCQADNDDMQIAD